MNSGPPGSACSSRTRTPSMSVSQHSTGLRSLISDSSLGALRHSPYGRRRGATPVDPRDRRNTTPERAEMTAPRLPDPAVVVLAGAAGSGKSTWAAARYRATEIVSSDALRAVVGSGPADLDATTEAFDLLDQIVTARTRRGLTTVIDTLGLDPERRRDYLRVARAAGLPAVLVILDTPARLCRERNRDRDRPVPAPVIAEQLRRVRRLVTEAEDEGWDLVLVESGLPAEEMGPEPGDGPSTSSGHRPGRPQVILQ